MKCKRGKWIPCALSKHKKGSLHRQLNVPKTEKIPENLLRLVMSKKIGDKIQWRGKRIPITRLLKQRANLALTLRRF